jgi:GT2 family glycosyltransferase
LDLDVVIVSYRCRELLRRCLASLPAAAVGRPLTVTVVDNASHDGTVEMLEREFPVVDVVGAARNLGFAAATNLGIRRGSAPYVLALNPDTQFRGDALGPLLALMEERREIAVCGCRLEREDGSLDHAAARSAISRV